MSWTNTFSYAVSVTVIYFCCSLYATVLLFWHVYHKLHQNKKNPNETSDHSGRNIQRQRSYSSSNNSNNRSDCNVNGLRSKMIRHGTTVCVVSMWIVILITALYRATELSMNGQNSKHSLGFGCKAYQTLVSYIWFISKLSLYSVLLARLQFAYEGTIYAYSNRLMNGIFATLMICYAVSMGSLPWFVRGQMTEMKGKGAGKSAVICEVDAHPLYSLWLALSDVSINLTLLYLFVSPLRQLFKDMENANSEDDQSVCASKSTNPPSDSQISQLELKMLPLKYTITTAVAVSSTLLGFLFVGLTRAAFLLVMDGCVNLTCLMILSSRFRNVYWLLCSPLLLCLAHYTHCLDDSYSEALVQIVEHYAKRDSHPSINDSHSDHRPQLKAVRSSSN